MQILFNVIKKNCLNMNHTLFTTIINCGSKAELKRLCKNATVTMSDIVDFVICCEAGITRLNHTMYYFDYVPPDLEVRDEDFAILDSSNDVRKTKESKKAFRRLFKDHAQRKYCVGHMFFSKELKQPFKEWHFIFFDLKELDDKNNHWKMGPHVHITNYLWPNYHCQHIWNSFVAQRQFPESKLHLACVNA